MKEGRPSSTAEFAATLRAAHQLLDGDQKILVDPVIIKLIEQSSVDYIQTSAAELRSPVMAAIRAFIAMRSRFAEDELEAAIQNGVRQYVVLGAGLDTFAYRQPPFGAQLRIFEVDHPASQRSKLDRLGIAKVGVPANVTFVPIDFERMDLRETLLAMGFDQRIPTFFSWLGVLAYLTWPAIESSLQFVASLPPPSGIAFSLFLPDSALKGVDLKAAEFLAAEVAARGEPVLTRLLPGEFEERLRSCGFSRVYDLTSEVSAERYFSARSDGLSQPLFGRMMSATV